ncbi:MAG TPA: hypothetical protein GX743_10700 [Actinomycetales bacterium]|nr:hypothetical protein [Actinomycetales bacterium]
MQLAVDIANIVTALMAVAAVLVAVDLGRKALKEAAHANLEAARSTAAALEANDQTEKTFLYQQVDGVLESALAFTAAVHHVGAFPEGDGEAQEQALMAAEEAFVNRLRVLTALRLIPEENEPREHVCQFAAAARRAVGAHRELALGGREVLAPFIFDQQDPPTEQMLTDLARLLHGHAEFEDQPGRVLAASDGQGVAEELDGSQATAQRLRENLAAHDEDTTSAELIRLLYPWLSVRLGWWSTHSDGEGAVAGLDDGQAPEWTDEGVVDVEDVPHAQPEVRDWLHRWIAGFNSPDSVPASSSVEDLSDQVWHGLRSEFLARLLALVEDMRVRIMATDDSAPRSPAPPRAAAGE